MIFKKSLIVASALGVIALALASGGCSSSNPTTDGGGGDDSGGGGTDAKPTDAKTDTKPPQDVVQPSMCPTPDATEAMKYMPTYIPPNPAKMDCNSTQIQGYWDNCRKMGATTMMCQAWGQANMACAKCLESARTDATWGPLVIGGGVISLNISGCVDLQGDKTCAMNYQAMDGCTRAACDMVCPVMDNQSFMDWQKCVQTAQTGVCKTYNDKVTMTCLGDASAAYNTCRMFQDFQSGYFVYAPLFCGGGG